jgi:hypothetical protein
MGLIISQNTTQSFENDLPPSRGFDLDSVIPREHVERYAHLSQSMRHIQTPKGA